MSAKPPETFGLDRLETPIGIALLITDADGALRALDWEDYEPRLRKLLRLHYSAPVLETAGAPDDIRAALSRYFAGDLASLSTIKWRVAGTPFQRKVWTALPRIPAGTTMSYGALAAQLGVPKAMRAVGLANGAAWPRSRSIA
jgi:methylated-DNA-[protein]-cysteine S-methyltransferase